MGITAPMMVVRGDGALITAAQAGERPIETILSGPAASIVGARWMTGADHALVSDIGGTTTDVAVLRDGRPAIDPLGARVGPYRTMVEAVAMRTTGLGGDSEVHMLGEGLAGGVTLGPRRLVPLSLMATIAPDVVLSTLEAQDRATLPGEHDGRFLRRVAGVAIDGLGEREAALLGRIGEDVVPSGAVMRSRMDHSALRRLLERGLVQVSGVTPSDAAHVLGWSTAWDAQAARFGLALLARRRVGSGAKLAETPEALAHMIAAQMTHQTSLALLEAAFAEEDPAFEADPAALARHELMQRGLGGYRGVMRVETGLAVPVVGLGASASTYYPPVGVRLGCEMILPQHAGVANAIGAVVGQISMRRSGTVTAPSEGRFRVHLLTGPEDFADAEAAMARLEDVLRDEAETAARAAGAEELQTNVSRDIRRADVEAREVFVEATIEVEARGRPRVAAASPG